jgi:uncharacterized protein YndB with AHSA1/START domain
MTASPEDSDAIIIRRRIAASREEVFDAWTDAEGMQLWMCPGDDIVSTVVQLDARVGGALRVIMQSPAGTYEHWGEFTTVDRPFRLAFTWRAKATDFVPTLVTVEFFEVAGGHCDLVLRHEKFPRRDARDQYRGGWGQIITRLDAFLQAQP